MKTLINPTQFVVQPNSLPPTLNLFYVRLPDDRNKYTYTITFEQSRDYRKIAYIIYLYYEELLALLTSPQLEKAPTEFAKHLFVPLRDT